MIQDIQPAALYPTYETLCGIYRIRYLLYGSGDRLTDPHDLEDYLFFDLDQSKNFLGVRTVMSVPGGHLLTAALTDSWEGVLSDVYAALWRDGFPMPAGLWSSEISFYGEDDRPVHTVLKSWRGSDSSDSLQLEQLSWEGFTSVTYCQPEYDRRSVWYLETTDPAFYTARWRTPTPRSRIPPSTARSFRASGTAPRRGASSRPFSFSLKTAWSAASRWISGPTEYWHVCFS